MGFRIYPYKLATESGRRLKEALGGRPLLKPDGEYRYVEGDKVINWGNTTDPDWLAGAAENMLNLPEHVNVAANKLSCFRALSEAGIPTVEWTVDRDAARNWEGVVYARHRLKGHSGEGIEIVHEDEDIPEAPLYTRQVNNNGEYRVHVMNGRVFDYRKKSRQVDDEATPEQNQVRTLENGWIYRQGQLRRLERIEELAVRTVTALNLDFAAVDIILDGGVDRPNDAKVLEVNTAVGLADNTLESYAEAFNENYNA